MKLVHYSSEPLGQLEIREPPKNKHEQPLKPSGLWVSDDDCEDNWRAWCVDSDIFRENLTHVHDVLLTPSANVLVLSTPREIDAFTREFRTDGPGGMSSSVDSSMWLDWSAVQQRWDGLIITPYIWSSRLQVMWYYSWDCASGCIWHPRAIASATLREVVPV